jgi:UDP-N-acetylmuramyl-tripeptide synthetase
MILTELIEPLPVKRVIGAGNIDITGIAYDSRRVDPGSLFVCIRGDRFDGHDFIGDALARGARAIASDDIEQVRAKWPFDFAQSWAGIAVVEVTDVRLALPVIAARFFGNPSRGMKLIGVTGTKGKTTTTYLVDSILRSAGYKTGVIGTLGIKIGDEVSPVTNTTPESLDLQAAFAHMIDSDVNAAVIEVSSHALVKHRVDECEFDVGIFTNLTQDHLDFHKTLDEYFKAKLIFFEELGAKSSKGFVGVINADDPRMEDVVRATKGRTLTFGIRNSADIRAINVVAGAGVTEFDVVSPDGVFHVSLKLGGIFNVSNALGAIGSGIALGLPIDAIIAGLESISYVPGRFVQVDCGQEFGVVIDYAHSPDSLENILKAARDLTAKRLIVVFGCGGDRDRGKRPIMGRIAGDLADVCVVTSDNPRTEDPGAIIQEILTGVGDKACSVEAITDRREAIERALRMAEPGDVVVIAGKGHEHYQIFKDRTIHFDDREVVEHVLGRAGS